MEREALVSIVVPVYNVEAYLLRCIDSLVRQTHKNLQIILVDDASTDGSGIIAQAITKQDERIVYVLHEKNGGLSAARNTGIERATGEWICFVDSDDWVEQDYVGAMLNEAIATSAEVAACGYDHVWDNGKTQSVDSLGGLTTQTEHRVMVALLRNHVTTRLYRRFLFTQTGLRFPQDIKRSEDIAISPALLSFTSRIAVVPRALYHYYQREGSLSKQNSPGQDFSFLDASLQRMAQNMNAGFDLEAQARFIMEILYSKVMLQLSNGYRLSQVREGIDRFVAAHPSWQDNPYLPKFPRMKRLFIQSAGKKNLLVNVMMIHAWTIMSNLKKR